MKNLDVIKNFVNGRKTARTKNLYVVGNKLVNYNTIIAIYQDGAIYLNKDKYSVTTSRIQNMIRREAAGRIIEVSENEINLLQRKTA